MSFRNRYHVVFLLYRETPSAIPSEDGIFPCTDL